MRIVFWPADNSGCGYYRCVVPARSLKRLALAETIVADAGDENLPLGDVIVLQRNVAIPRLAAALQAREEHGCLLVIEEDDNFRALPPDNPAWEEFHPLNSKKKAAWLFERMEGDEEITVDGKSAVEKFGLPQDRYWQELESYCRKELDEDEPDVWNVLRSTPEVRFHDIHRSTVKSGDLMTVTTPHLAKVYGQINPNVRVLPNCLDFEEPVYNMGRPKKDHEGVILGWAGSLTHMGDLKHVQGVIKQLLDEYDGKNGKPLLRLFIGAEFRVFQELLPTYPGMRWFIEKVMADFENVPIAPSLESMSDFRTVESDCGRFIYARAVPVDKYPLMFRDIDIGIVPGRPEQEFYQAKSCVKKLEMGAMFVPTVVSAFSEYADMGEAEGAIVVRNNQPRYWLKALRKLIEDTSYRKEMGEHSHEFSLSRSIDRHSYKWPEAYYSTLQRGTRFRPPLEMPVAA